MLDVRVYRTAFLPALVALFVAAFALVDRPTPVRSPLPADAFSTDRAYGNDVNPAPESLLGMARDFPSRAPGSPGDNGLADRVARVFAAPDEQGGHSPFQVTRMVTSARTADGPVDVQTVVATRPGQSSRRIVLLASRDAVGRPGLAELSATAALLELARVLKTRDIDKTLVLVSTSGATTGFAGARAWAKANAGTPVDGVIVLGDVAGAQVRKPWVVAWPSSSRPVALGLERTVQAAVRGETKSNPGGPHALGQWIRRALGVTVSQQGPIAAEGLPATMISVSGERGAAPDQRIVTPRAGHDGPLGAFGRAALRAVTALDVAGSGDAPAFAGVPNGIVTLRNVLPDWAVRLVIATLLLPALLAALDAYFRARRRRVAIGAAALRITAGAVPVLVAWLWVRLLGVTGLIASADGAVIPRAFPRTTSAYVAAATAVLAAAAAWYFARRATRVTGPPDGHAIAVGLTVCGLATLVWIVNPYAAALLLPAAHAWPFAAGGWRLRLTAGAVVAGLLLPLVAVVYVALALGLGPLDLAWAGELAVAGGNGLWTALVVAVLAAALGGLLRIALARHAAARGTSGGGEIKTRGPLSYAGPGSLGGTESALRR